ncbi:MAG TPA: type II toxin-antitoxin system RatA family toxin [Woeseiaceae bacterium]|nr:type II toxin-antitoxin system RatA family toxin [Woeseiaceae bacterium]
MRTVSRNALVPYSAPQMYALVDDIESYPEFLPWCDQAEVRARSEHQVEATIHLRRGGLTKSFTTRNRLQPPEIIALDLLSGPFRKLRGQWKFQALAANACKVSLHLEFDFDNRLTDMLFGSFFESTCNSLVDAFTRRAHDIYGVPVVD